MAEDLGLAEDIEVMDRLVDVASKHAVDAGCGSGMLARALVKRGARVTAFEPEPGQAEINRQNLAGGAIEFHETGAEAMPCADASIDVVFFSKSLHHVPTDLMEKALQEAMRVLKSGSGMLYVLEPEVGGTHTELMLPFHNESAARAAARAILKKVAEPCFDAAREIHFHNRRSYENYETFVDQVGGYGFNAYDRSDVDTLVVKALFEAGRCDEGYRFEQPMRVNLFKGLRGRRHDLTAP
ncbi:MAG: class I SAM-dependent methyltransferase [Rhodospirillaceae bacterium]|jgi:ubiquinone/menaquinone biosynthesis C-methylase UbiE|nr:class I SAM-dependent methyltransferase [Rhodospirillaceae bacterium]MBT7613966.1 class I SAM-dependent methyltransferase [Rhodospirillaceae bacterium]MBT7648182.1 class I SAM-dependent methyltransferase [Rhodospirillaceae bacterium]